MLAGLRNEWVNKAMHRQWGRVGPWEMQIFQKLSQFVNAEDDFKAMHEAISAMVDAKPIDVRSHASTIMSSSNSDSQSWGKSTEGSVPSACVPFIGACCWGGCVDTLTGAGCRCLPCATVSV